MEMGETAGDGKVTVEEFKWVLGLGSNTPTYMVMQELWIETEMVAECIRATEKKDKGKQKGK